MILAVTGGRALVPGPALARRFYDVVLERVPVPYGVLRHGGAGERSRAGLWLRGADLWAADAAATLGLAVVEYPADWGLHGKAAGPIRNRAMLEGPPGVRLLIAFPGNRGTADCIRAATERGIEVVRL